MPTSASAFVSYSRHDSDFALRLAADLKAAGAAVWLDQLDIEAGHHWDRSIETALKHAERIILILSPDSVSSNNVMDEVNYALEEQKVVVPVFYLDCPVPWRLRRIQQVDFRKDYARGMQNLLKYMSVPQPQPVERKPLAAAKEKKVKAVASTARKAPVKRKPAAKKGTTGMAPPPLPPSLRSRLR